MFGWIEKHSARARRMPEISGAMDGVLMAGQSGLVSGTRVASNLGWRAVEALSVGDRVLTFDHGMQTIVDIQRETLFAPEGGLPAAQCPVLIPEGVLNNRTDTWMMPEQGVLVESDAASDALGDPFAIVPARALEGVKGVRTVSPDFRLDVITLAFEDDEVVYVEGGMLAHFPRPRCLVSDARAATASLYDVLDLGAARFLVECMIEEEKAADWGCQQSGMAGLAAAGPQRAASFAN